MGNNVSGFCCAWVCSIHVLEQLQYLVCRVRPTEMPGLLWSGLLQLLFQPGITEEIVDGSGDGPRLIDALELLFIYNSSLEHAAGCNAEFRGKVLQAWGEQGMLRTNQAQHQ